MKKTIHLFIGALFMTMLLFSTACKKNNDKASVTNTATIKFNGTQSTIDSVTSVSYASNGSIDAINIWTFVHSNPLSYCKITLEFSPSDPLYAAGTVITLASSLAARITYQSSNLYGDPYRDISQHFVGGNGTITITKNDFNNRRLEGTLTDCVATNPANTNDKVTIDGSFAVTYPLP